MLLEELNRHPVASVQMLHSATGLPKATIVRLLKTLCALGYAINDRRQGGYAVASRVKALSNGFRGDPMVVEAARPFALAFTRKHHWPIAVCVLHGAQMLVRFNTIPDSPLAPLDTTINKSLSLMGRAVGRAYLAFCPADERERLLEQLVRSDHHEDSGAHDRELAMRTLSAIRDRGYADREPWIDARTNTLAVPVIEQNKVLATIGMTYFTAALSPEERVRRFVPLLQDMAQNITASVISLR